MIRQIPEQVFDGDRMIRGVIVRICFCPDASLILKRSSGTYTKPGRPDLFMFNEPVHAHARIGEQYPELDCRVKRRSYEKLVDFAWSLA